MKKSLRPLLFLLTLGLLLSGCGKKGNNNHCSGNTCTVGAALVKR